MGKTHLIIFILICFLINYGCAPKVVKIEEPAVKIEMGKEDVSEKKVDDQTKVGEEKEHKVGKVREEDIQVVKIEGKGVGKEESTKSPLRDVHFDFDSYSIRKEDIELLNQIAKWLKENRNIKILIEGHCDERGTVEYNLVLGQKRADTVKSHLRGMGIDETRLRTISYGKERPLDPAHTDEAWAKNRRVHFEVEK